jgi:hypothetical protein
MKEFESLSITASIKPGSDITRACTDLIGFASKLGVTVEAEFNGVTLLANPNGDAAILSDNWQNEMNSERQYKIAGSRVRQK